MMSIRRNVVLKLFISHYIQMAHVASSTFRSLNQGTMYLKHADRLCRLFYIDGYEWDGEEYSQKIASMRVKIERVSIQDIPRDRPALPRRESTLVPPKRNRVRKLLTCRHQSSVTEECDNLPYKNISSLPIATDMFEWSNNDEWQPEESSNCPTNLLKSKRYDQQCSDGNTNVTVAEVYTYEKNNTDKDQFHKNEILNSIQGRASGCDDKIILHKDESFTEDSTITNANLATILGNI